MAEDKFLLSFNNKVNNAFIKFNKIQASVTTHLLNSNLGYCTAISTKSVSVILIRN